MAASCSTAFVGSCSGSFFVTLPSNGRPQPSPSPSTLFQVCCCAQLSQRRSWRSISQRPGSTEESRAPRRSRAGGQQRLSVRPRSEPPSLACCLPTDVSSDAASTELNVAEGNESGMSIEEKNAILAFEEGLSPDGSSEERDSSEGVQSLSGKEEPEASQAIEKRESITDVVRQPEGYEPSPNDVKGPGATVASVITLFINLLDRPSAGDGRMLASAGSAVLERLEEEVGKLQAMEGVDGQSVFESMRLVKLLRMDIQLIAAARKGSTLSERLVQAKEHCRQLLNILSAL